MRLPRQVVVNADSKVIVCSARLDVHAALAAYEAAKARVFEGVARPSDAVVNAADPVVMAHAPDGASLFGGAATPSRIDVVGDAALLIVDDEPNLLESFKIGLEVKDYDVTIADGGKKALS